MIHTRNGEVMSSPAIAASLRMPVHEAAARMRAHDVGMLPVIDEETLIGVVTDRDLVTRVFSVPGASDDVPVSSAMTRAALTCFEDQPVHEAAALMGDNQIRRLAVVDRAGRLVGVLSVGDIAENISEELAGQTLGEIVEER